MGDGSKQQRRKRCESQVSMNLAVARKLEHTLGSRTSILRSVELSPLSLARLPLGSGLLPWAQKRRVHCTVGGSGEGGGEADHCILAALSEPGRGTASEAESCSRLHAAGGEIARALSRVESCRFEAGVGLPSGRSTSCRLGDLHGLATCVFCVSLWGLALEQLAAPEWRLRPQLA